MIRRTGLTAALSCLLSALAAAAEVPVSGRLTAAGDPVPEARILLLPELGAHAAGERYLTAPGPSRPGLSRLGPQPVADAASGADGLFTLSAPAAGLYRVRIEKPGFVPLELPSRPLVEDHVLPDAELERARPVAVSVRGPDGAELAARVRAVRKEPDAGSWPQLLRRSRRGRGSWLPGASFGETAPGRKVTLSLAAPAAGAGDDAIWVVEAHVDGWPPVREELAPGDRGEIELKVAPGVERRIETVDARGRPLAGVLAWLEDGILPMAVTDEGGRATLALADGEVALRLTGPGGRRAAHRLTGPGGRRAAHRLQALGEDHRDDRVERIVLDDPRSVSGRVLDEDSRHPIAGALVWNAGGEVVTTGADGGYTVAGTARDLSTLFAAAAGYATGFGRFQPGASAAEAARGPTLTLSLAATVGGVVVDRDGRPLPSVEIDVQPQHPRRQMMSSMSLRMFRTQQARTSRDGRFRIPGLPLPSGYTLRFTKSGLAPAEVEIEKLETFEERGQLRVVMAPGRRGVGWVVDEDDAPVAGAEVRLEKADANARGRRMRFFRPGDDDDEPGVFTDREGRFEISDLAAGRYALTAEAPGFAAATVPGLEIPGGTGEVDLGTLVLSPGAAVEGRVVDAVGAPVAGAEVRVAETSRMPMAFTRRRMAGQPPAATTGADGAFVVRDQKPGTRIDLSVEKEGYVAAAVAGVEPPTATPLEIVLRPSSKVLGRILDGDGRPIAEAMVQVRPERQGGSGRVTAFAAWRTAASGEDGTFEVLDVEPGRVSVMAQAPGFRRRELSGLEVPAGEPLRDVELRLLPGAEVRGTVTEADGTPVVGAMVAVTEPDAMGMSADGVATTDGDGHYQLAGVGLGPRTVTATDRNSRRTARSIDVDEGTHVVDLVFEVGVEVSGHVLDTAGVAVEGASVRLEDGARTGVRTVMMGMGNLEAITSADGSFVLASVESGSYRLSASREGFAPATLDDPVTVAESPLSGLVVRLERGATLSGRILGLEYDDLVRVEVRAGGGFAQPDFEGRYEIPNLGVGDHTVWASVPGSGRQVRDQVTVPEGATEVVVDLEFGSGYILTGVVLHGERPLAGANLYMSGVTVSHYGSTVVGQDGSFRLEGLEEGRYRLYVSSYDTGLQHNQEIEILSDDDVRIEIQTAEVAGLVRDAFDFEPVEGADLQAEVVAADAPPAMRLTSRRARSDARGYFSLGEVSEGTWKVTATKTGYGPAEEVVEVRAGRPVDGLELAMTATEGLYFEVRMSSGRAPRGVVLALLDGGGNRVAGGTFETTDGGKVRFTTAPAGSWEMLLLAEDGAVVSVPVTSPGKLGTITVPESGSLEVRVPDLGDGAVTARVRLTGPDGRLHRGLGWGGAVAPEPTLRGGFAQISNLAPGTWTVTVIADDGRTWSGRTAVLPGQTAEVSLP